MIRLLGILLVTLFLFTACEEDLDYQQENNNEDIVGTWNLKALRSYDCAEDGLFDVQLNELESEPDSFIRDVRIMYDSIVWNEIELKYDTFPIDRIEKELFQQEGIVDYTKDSIAVLDPITGQLIRYVYRYEPVIQTDAYFNFNAVFDTTRFTDQVIEFEECTSRFNFASNNTGVATISFFNESSGDTSAMRNFSWSQSGADDEIEICFDGEGCKTYEFTTSASGSLFLYDGNFNYQSCNKADYTLEKVTGRAGTFKWSSLEITGCNGVTESYSFDSLSNCDIDPADQIWTLTQYICREMQINCNNTATEFANYRGEDVVFNYDISELEGNRLLFTQLSTGQTFNSWPGEFLDDNTFTFSYTDRTLFNGQNCQEMKFTFVRQ